MRNKTLNSKSKFLGKRRRFFLNRKSSHQNFNFVKMNKGSISSSVISPGIIKCSFSSQSTGRSAFAFGPDLGSAYSNMIEKYNRKYGGL